MNSHPLVAAASALAALVTGFAALSAPPRLTAAADTQTPADPARVAQLKALYAEKCSACHNLPNPQAQGLTRAGWRRTVDRMLNQHHASDSISPAEADQIVAYLATFAPKTGPRRPSDPWATDADDVWTVAPSTTRVFNFEVGPTLTGLSLLAAGAPGPAPYWRVIPDPSHPDGNVVKVRAVKPTPSRFALLMDKADQIVAYLATFAPKAGPRRPSDPWATDADDVWTVAPSATRVFNFEAGPTLTGLSLLAAGAPGPAPYWRVIPDPSHPDG
ncbi:MAG: hypothetical protein JO250_05935, partial [Armatimonadetes bacterium]|nr:hypothetical protein [Armatimonadota bacterium]